MLGRRVGHQQGRVRVGVRRVVGRQLGADDGREQEEAEQPGTDFGLERQVPPDVAEGAHRAVSLPRVRGSMKTTTMSTMKLAISTANTITRKIACIIGKSSEETAF